MFVPYHEKILKPSSIKHTVSFLEKTMMFLHGMRFTDSWSLLSFTSFRSRKGSEFFGSAWIDRKQKQQHCDVYMQSCLDSTWGLFLLTEQFSNSLKAVSQLACFFQRLAPSPTDFTMHEVGGQPLHLFSPYGSDLSEYTWQKLRASEYSERLWTSGPPFGLQVMQQWFYQCHVIY